MPRKSKGSGLDEKTRIKIAESLPAAIEHAIQSYRQFYNKSFGEKDKARDFGAHHTACKAAIAHIELLLKLADWAELASKNDNSELSVLMLNAQSELERYQEEEGDA